MKLEVKKVDSIKRELKFEISKDRVSAKLEEVYKAIAKDAKIKGFRPGKAPRHVLEKHHSQLAQEEMIRNLISEAYQEGLKKESIHPIDYPEIGDVNYKDGILKFTAKLDIRPEFDVKDYKGIKVQRKSSAVTDEEINKTLEYFKQGQGKDKEVAVDDTFVKGLGYPNLDEFKKVLSRQMEMDKDRQNRHDVEEQIITELLKQAKFPVPESLINRQIEQRVHQHTEHSKKHHGATEKDIAAKEVELRQALREPVEKDIKVYMVLDKIAQQEKIEVGENDNLPAKVMEFLLKEAEWTSEEKKSSDKKSK